MEKRLTPGIRRRPDVRAWSEKFNFSKQIAGVLRDLQDDQRWKYDELPPVQLLEKLKLENYLADNDELARTEYVWSRRPRFLPPISCVVWLIVVLGLPIWLFSVPATGVALLIVSAVLVNTDIVRSVRWRRQYESSVHRLVRTKGTLPGRKNSK